MTLARKNVSEVAYFMLSDTI